MTVAIPPTIRPIQGTDRYYLTPTDVLWLLRAVSAEGQPYARVAAALVSGFLWARQHGVAYWRDRSRTLADWVRAYAQPVNPRWLPTGDLHLARLASAQRSGDETLIKRLERNALHRVEVQRRTRFLDHHVAAVREALARGDASGETDYAAPDVRPDNRRYPVANQTTGPRENRFYTRDRGWRGWIGAGDVIATRFAALLDEATRSASSIAVLALALLGAWAAWRVLA